MTAFDHAFKLADKTETGRHGVPPAGLCAFVAGRPVRNRADKKSVRIAVSGDGDQMQIIAAGLPFRPKSLAGAAEKCHETACLCLFESLGVHITEHQNLKGVLVLDDGRHESVSTGFKSFKINHIH